MSLVYGGPGFQIPTITWDKQGNVVEKQMTVSQTDAKATFQYTELNNKVPPEHQDKGVAMTSSTNTGEMTAQSFVAGFAALPVNFPSSQVQNGTYRNVSTTSHQSVSQQQQVVRNAGPGMKVDASSQIGDGIIEGAGLGVTTTGINTTHAIAALSMQTQTDVDDDKIHKCSYCEKAYRRRDQLRRHEMVHTGERPHKCMYCNKGFRTTDHLKNHVLSHTGERPFKCEICGKAYTKSFILKQHMVTHTGESKFVCICGKVIADKYRLKMHMRTHTGEKPYPCTICGKRFKQKDHLKRHGLSHVEDKPHKCDICGKGYTNLFVLDQHKMRHTGSRPYTCEYCNKSFIQADRLKRHILIHTGEKPFKCIQCDTGFKLKSQLNRHIRNHVTQLSKVDINTPTFSLTL